MYAPELPTAHFVGTGLIVFILLVNTSPSALSFANDASADITSTLPVAVRSPVLDPATFRVTTRRAVTAREYKMLGLADRGAIRPVGGYKVSVVADSRRRLALVERSCCALQEWIIFALDRPLRSLATPVTLSNIGIGGVSVGSAASLVAQQFGRAEPLTERGGDTVLRYRYNRNHDCSTFYTFVVKRGRVAAISVKNAC
ncbi:MAG TPA: hypothetical protein VGN14_00770 [Candidatus Elarobacter sp.]